MAAAAGVVAAAETHVRHALSALGVDASHDYAHIERVRRLALRIAREEGLGAEALEVVELAALLHDIVRCRLHSTFSFLIFFRQWPVLIFFGPFL